MTKKIVLSMSLAAFVAGSAYGTEWRAPLVSLQAPLRYDIEEKPNKWTFETWTVAHYRNANKAFLKHGTETKQLPALFFGKEDFTVADAFDPAAQNYYFEKRNPFLTSTHFTPRSSYEDRGATMGARFEVPVFKGEGRIGARVNVPFRTVRMERDDEGEQAIDGRNNSVIRSDSVLITDSAGTKKVFSGIDRFRASLLGQLKFLNNDGSVQSILRVGDAPANHVFVANTEYDKGTPAATTYNGDILPFIFIRGDINGLPTPTGAPVGVTASIGGTNKGNFIAAADGNARIAFGTIIGDISAPANATRLQDLAATGVIADANKARGFAPIDGNDYHSVTPATLETLWAVPVFDGVTAQPTNASRGAQDLINRELGQYSTGVEEFLAQQGIVVQTNQHTGLGDIDLDFFYQHNFDDKWVIEGVLGVRFPTGGSNQYFANPFRVQLGNGNHFELKLGVNAGFKPCKCMTLKVDANYSFVLEAKEQRSAVFKNSTIKGFGPRLDADVDWGYFLGHLDTTWYHPKNQDLSTTVGYEFYYKTKDSVKFKSTKAANHILGKVWGDTVTGVPASSGGAAPANPGFADFAMDVDNKLAEKDTESIAHRLRGETNWRVNDQLSLFLGGAFTFAGQNIARESDLHGGLSVRW